MTFAVSHLIHFAVFNIGSITFVVCVDIFVVIILILLHIKYTCHGIIGCVRSNFYCSEIEALTDFST